MLSMKCSYLKRMKNATMLGKKIKPSIWLKLVEKKIQAKVSIHEKVILKALGQCLSFENTILPTLQPSLFLLFLSILTFLLTSREHPTITEKKMFSQSSSPLLFKGDCNRLACRALLVESLADSIHQFDDESYSKRKKVTERGRGREWERGQGSRGNRKGKTLPRWPVWNRNNMVPRWAFTTGGSHQCSRWQW